MTHSKIIIPIISAVLAYSSMALASRYNLSISFKNNTSDSLYLSPMDGTCAGGSCSFQDSDGTTCTEGSPCKIQTGTRTHTFQIVATNTCSVGQPCSFSAVFTVDTSNDDSGDSLCMFSYYGNIASNVTTWNTASDTPAPQVQSWGGNCSLSVTGYDSDASVSDN